MDKKDLALNDLQWLIGHKIKLDQIDITWNKLKKILCTNYRFTNLKKMFQQQTQCTLLQVMIVSKKKNR